MEIWKNIESLHLEFEYQVSNLGNVRSMNYRGTGSIQILKVRLSPSKARQTLLAGRTVRSIAQLVLCAFGEPRPSEKHFSHHKDGNVMNDCIENLEWRHIQDQNILNRHKGIYPKNHPNYKAFAQKNSSAANQTIDLSLKSKNNIS
jgi:NUMOD4 motif